MSEDNEYTISISNIFYAKNHMDAVEQMVQWLIGDGGAAFGGYRVETKGFSVFVDAEDIESVRITLDDKKDLFLENATEDDLKEIL